MDSAAAATAAVLQAAIVGLQNVFITRYISAAGFVVLLYDHLLTFDDEVEYIWKAPATMEKFLFLFLRYMVLVFLTVQTWFTDNCNVRSDVKSGLHSLYVLFSVLRSVNETPSQTYAGWLSIVILNLLVLQRIWTTLPRGHRLIGVSLSFFIFMQLASLAVTSWVVSNMIPVLVFEPTVGLCTFTSKPTVFPLWVPGIVFEVVVFLTVCWNTLDRPRALGPDSDSHITRMLFRDGVIYFVLLFALRVANTVIAVVAPISLIFVVVFFIWAATTVTTSRLIINARRELGREDRLWKLQMEDLETDGCVDERHSTVDHGRSRT
ncbi:hypothetical protein MVEN_01646700 [Mycena venus]|uniref:DUF6533 domain-containing protein n=1 Tax=Mycena venus TaxID=2733690 RepID=A0A8H6XN79_9AGAR|nr:hypothetical protein MVEN_01646700 [Mycena venus]